MKVILNNTNGALGDAVCMMALTKALIGEKPTGIEFPIGIITRASKGDTRCLWDDVPNHYYEHVESRVNDLLEPNDVLETMRELCGGIEDNQEVYRRMPDANNDLIAALRLPEDPWVPGKTVMVQTSLIFENFNPNINSFPYEEGRVLPGGWAPFYRWMGLQFERQTGIGILVKDEYAAISLTEDELSIGENIVKGVTEKYGGKQPVVIGTKSAMDNKTVPEHILEDLVEELKKEVVFVQFKPGEQEVEGTEIIGPYDLRKVGAVLAYVPFIGADTFLTHMASAAKRGTEAKDIDLIYNKQSDIIVILGSSGPGAVPHGAEKLALYGHTLQCPGGIPCAQHNYGGRSLYKYRFTREDGSSCAFPQYINGPPPCLTGHSGREIADVLRGILSD